MTSKSKGKTVAFLHPDLGIGGAERLIVDAAVALQQKGYKVVIITGYHDQKRAFPETVDGTLKVINVGWWIPRSLFGRFVALCAYFKMIYAAIYLTLFSGIKPRFVVCDQVSACIPFLRLRWSFWKPAPRILFYCHFPDQLLTQRMTFLKSLYRWPLDWFEQFTTSLADKIVVNSEFTRGIFHETFKRIKTVPDVLYPSINSDLFDRLYEANVPKSMMPDPPRYLFLSINRFERKKNIGLVVLALKKLKQCLTEEEWKYVHLVLAGGFDKRLPEQVEYYAEIKDLILKEDMGSKVTLVKSPDDDIKVYMLGLCVALIYTPSNEHFGIVPLEAMYMERPVIAVDSGGPRETVKDEVTGMLCPAISTHFGVAMARLIKDPELGRQMGLAGKQRFMELFSFETFSKNWVKALQSLEEERLKKRK